MELVQDEIDNLPEEPGVAADLALPPDWLTAIGSIMWVAIVGGIA